MPITQQSLDFLFKNWATDSREWFQEHRQDYLQLVVEPLKQLVIDLTPGMLEIDESFITEPKIDRTISRIHRDMRIPHNRSGPRYRQNVWLIFIRDKKLYNGLPAFYMEMDPGSFTYGMGYYQPAAESMHIFRQMLLSGEPAAKKAVRAFERQSVFHVEGEQYKRPKHPDAPKSLLPFIERKSLSLVRESEDFGLLFSENLADTLLADFRKIAPFYHFLIEVESRRQKL